MSNKSRRNTFVRLTLAVIVVLATFFIYQKMGRPLLASYKYTSVSPDQKYRVDVYSEPLYFAMPGGGGAGSHDAAIILRNSWGWKIGSNHGCDMFMDDVNIEWNSDKYVNIALARSIDFETGQCEQ